MNLDARNRFLNAAMRASLIGVALLAWRPIANAWNDNAIVKLTYPMKSGVGFALYVGAFAAIACYAYLCVQFATQIQKQVEEPSDIAKKIKRIGICGVLAMGVWLGNLISIASSPSLWRRIGDLTRQSATLTVGVTLIVLLFSGRKALRACMCVPAIPASSKAFQIGFVLVMLFWLVAVAGTIDNAIHHVRYDWLGHRFDGLSPARKWRYDNVPFLHQHGGQLAALGLIAVTTRAIQVLNRSSVQTSRCANCGYDLGGISSNRCPECGTQLPTGNIRSA